MSTTLVNLRSPKAVYAMGKGKPNVKFVNGEATVSDDEHAVLKKHEHYTSGLIITKKQYLAQKAKAAGKADDAPPAGDGGKPDDKK